LFLHIETRAHLVEDLHRFVELYIPQEWGQVLEEIDQQLCVHRPTLEENISPLERNSQTTNMGKGNIYPSTRLKSKSDGVLLLHTFCCGV